jgi:hypothetical protein
MLWLPTIRCIRGIKYFGCDVDERIPLSMLLIEPLLYFTHC